MPFCIMDLNMKSVRKNLKEGLKKYPDRCFTQGTGSKGRCFLLNPGHCTRLENCHC